MKKKAFTLAEIMIVLTVIGILTAILLPAAIHSTPNENVMKFKKAHNTLYKVINELVSSDKYYKDGDLGVRANGALIDGTHSGDNLYLCNTFAEILSAKNINCTEDGEKSLAMSRILSIYTGTPSNEEIIDGKCKITTTTSKIITTDNIIYFETAPKVPFGISTGDAWSNNEPDGTTGCVFGAACAIRLFHDQLDANGFDTHYKIYCIDIDGIGTGEDPFGYGIRSDGKIMPGARALEWLQKSIQDKE